MSFSTSTISKRKTSRLGLATMVLALAALLTPASPAQQAPPPVAQPAPASAASAGTYKPLEGDYIAHDFHFKSGETLPELRLHYRTLGTPTRDATGRVTNAVLILHGTGGWGGNFLSPQFAGVLYGPGQLLDITRYYIILPDNIGHGKSSKPSDGLRAHFPQYDYNDMVAAQYELLEKGLAVNHLRLILGTSMGCMHSWIWGEIHPDFMDAMMPLACQPAPIAGRNRAWRKLVIDGIHDDPDWKNGDYTVQPQAGLKVAGEMFFIAGGAALPMQKNLPTRAAADAAEDDFAKGFVATHDANDLLFAVRASWNYDPSAELEKISVPVMFVNSADDFINPPELGIAEREIKRVKKGKFVLIPISDQGHGHGTHT